MAEMYLILFVILPCTAGTALFVNMVRLKKSGSWEPLSDLKRRALALFSACFIIGGLSLDIAWLWQLRSDDLVTMLANASPGLAFVGINLSLLSDRNYGRCLGGVFWVGISLIFASALGSAMAPYEVGQLGLGGFVAAAGAALAYWALAEKPQKRYLLGLYAIGVGVFFVFCNPYLRWASFRTYVWVHGEDLSAMNSLLVPLKKEVLMAGSDWKRDLAEFSEAELTQVQSLSGRLHAGYIYKSDKSIYYELYGFLQHRWGITYWTGISEEPPPALRKIVGKWHY